MVIKRGEQQRFESDRIYNVPFLKKDDKNYKTDMLMNKTNYVQLAKMHNAAGSINMEDLENDPDFFDMLSSNAGRDTEGSDEKVVKDSNRTKSGN